MEVERVFELRGKPLLKQRKIMRFSFLQPGQSTDSNRSSNSIKTPIIDELKRCLINMEELRELG